MRDVHDETSVIDKIDKAAFHKLKEENAIFAGMIPKLDNAFEAISAGVRKVVIGDAIELIKLIKGESGTTIH